MGTIIGDTDSANDKTVVAFRVEGSRASRLLNYIYRVGRSERSAERSRLDRHGPSLFLSLSGEKSCLIFTGEKIRWYAARANIDEQTFPSSQGRCDHCPSAGALLAHPIDNSLPVDRVLQLGGSHPESQTSRSSWEITRNSSRRYSPAPYLDRLRYSCARYKRARIPSSQPCALVLFRIKISLRASGRGKNSEPRFLTRRGETSKSGSLCSRFAHFWKMREFIFLLYLRKEGVE